MLILDEQNILAQGHFRKVYSHPLDDDLLVKVLKPVKHSKRFLSRFNLSCARYGRMTTAFREYEEYISAVARLDRLPTPLPLFHGFVETNLGVAMVVEKIKGADGEVALNIHEYIERHGFTEDLGAMIDALEETVKAEHIICSDLKCENVVISSRGLVVVDGTSDKVFFSINRYSKTLFLRWCARKFDRLRAAARSYETA